MKIDSGDEMEAFGARLGALPGLHGVLYLSGPLGAGKTTWVRGLLGALGHHGRVRSPTYTLIESYSLSGLQVHHFDLYRLADPEELEYIGLRDLIEPGVLCLVEWPERAMGRLPAQDLTVEIRIADSAREVCCRAATPLGERMLAVLS